MHPAHYRIQPDSGRDKRQSFLLPVVEGPTAKRSAHETAEEPSGFFPKGTRSCEEFQNRAWSSHFSNSQASSAAGDDISSAERQFNSATENPYRAHQRLPEMETLSASKPETGHNVMAERQSRSQRTPEDVELAIEVLNDALADASPLDRPSLELATQTLMERLVEMRKHKAQEESRTRSSEGLKQSTHEYSRSLQAVIVGEGTQKYTLIRIPQQDDMASDIYLVRGDPKADYHYQTALETLNGLQDRNIISDVTGGGRMDVSRAEKKIQIYGFSHQYGAADHSITANMVKEHFGEEFIVSFGNYGY